MGKGLGRVMGMSAIVSAITIKLKNTTKKIGPKRNTPRHIIIKLSKIKDKERILKAAREEDSYLQRSSHKTINRISKETFQAKKGLKEVFEVMKGKDLHPRLLYPEKLSFRMEGQIKCFPDKVKLKEFIITKPYMKG